MFVLKHAFRFKLSQRLRKCDIALANSIFAMQQWHCLTSGILS